MIDHIVGEEALTFQHTLFSEKRPYAKDTPPYNSHLEETWEVTHSKNKSAPPCLGQGPAITVGVCRGREDRSGMRLKDNKQKTRKVSTQKKADFVWLILGTDDWTSRNTAKEKQKHRRKRLSVAPSISQLSSAGTILNFCFTWTTWLFNHKKTSA